ncbi:hypothetical protein AQUCO_15900002v1 [Aquilegia coerulea]|uniref:Uncharacterized protein n=1 Tax=Aquilegia coerulea TaxID=218851 RepID=A0A2G5C0W0_AQUCA|nr:hypothetical protein AQUCO_15900002v1 [Aquilegia coerulea]
MLKPKRQISPLGFQTGLELHQIKDLNITKWGEFGLIHSKELVCFNGPKTENNLLGPTMMSPLLMDNSFTIGQQVGPPMQTTEPVPQQPVLIFEIQRQITLTINGKRKGRPPGSKTKVRSENLISATNSKKPIDRVQVKGKKKRGCGKITDLEDEEEVN